MDVTGHPDGPPTRVGVAITDFLAGLYAMNGILLALRDRDRTDRGQHVDIALMDAMTSALALPAGIYFNTGEAPGREGNQHHSLTPYEAVAPLVAVLRSTRRRRSPQPSRLRDEHGSDGQS